MAITYDTFIERYPIFEGIAEEVIEQELEFSAIKVAYWQDPYKDKAIALLTAHTLRLEHGDLIKLGANLRAIEEGSEIKTDLIDLSLPYHQQTIYGQQYLNLRQQVKGISIFVV